MHIGHLGIGQELTDGLTEKAGIAHLVVCVSRLHKQHVWLVPERPITVEDIGTVALGPALRRGALDKEIIRRINLTADLVVRGVRKRN